MKQLLLDLDINAPPTLDNFVVGSNGELLTRLREIAAGAIDTTTTTPHLYLWGSPGSGRTHLLQATVSATQAQGRAASLLGATAIEHELPELVDGVLAIDDVDQLDDRAQIALFNAFNRSRACAQTLVLAGSLPPLELALREDLRTRIGQCLIFALQPLDDEARALILNTLAQRRGLHLADEVVDYLLRHGERDLSRLLTVFDALDTASLQRKRPISLPLLRELIQLGLSI